MGGSDRYVSVGGWWGVGVYSRCVCVQLRRVGGGAGQDSVRECRVVVRGRGRGGAGRAAQAGRYMQHTGELTCGEGLPASLGGARRQHERRRGRGRRRGAEPRPRHAGHPQPCAHIAPLYPSNEPSPGRYTPNITYRFSSKNRTPRNWRWY